MMLSYHIVDYIPELQHCQPFPDDKRDLLAFSQYRTLKRECNCFSVKLSKRLYETIQARSVICFVRAKHKMKTFLTLKRNPGKLAAVIIKESGREAYSFSRSHICESTVMVRTVKIGYPP